MRPMKDDSIVCREFGDLHGRNRVVPVEDLLALVWSRWEHGSEYGADLLVHMKRFWLLVFKIQVLNWWEFRF